MKKINLSIVLEDVRVGGPQKQLIYFLNSISFFKYNIVLIIPNKNNKSFKKLISNSNIKIVETQISIPSIRNILGYILFFCKEIYKLKDILKTFNTDIIYVPGGTISFKTIFVAKILNLKAVWHIHDCKSNVIIRKIFQSISKKNIQTIFASEKSRYYYLKKFRDKSHVIRSSVNTKTFNKKIKKTSRKIRVALIANINPDKNIKLFFDIVSKNKNKNISFLMFGNIWNSQRKYFNKLIVEYPKALSKIKWYKNEFNHFKIYKKIDLLVCTSETESFPLTFSEALSFSIPIVTTNVGDVKIFKKINKKFSCIINDNDSLKFLDKFNFFLKNKSVFNSYRKNSREYAKNNLDINIFIKRITSIFENFLEKKI